MLEKSDMNVIIKQTLTITIPRGSLVPTLHCHLCSPMSHNVYEVKCMLIRHSSHISKLQILNNTKHNSRPQGI